jgi:hypothetical protein
MKSLFAALMLASALLTMLPGCQSITIPTTGTANKAKAYVPCVSLSQISYSAKSDTPETVRQIVPQNAVIAANCPGKP